MNESAEIRKRLDRRIASAKVSHMNDTKWRKLFTAIKKYKSHLNGISIKFVGDDRLFTSDSYSHIPGPDFQYDDNFGECSGLSYTPFKEIEFVEIPSIANQSNPNDIDGFIASLENIGKFPISKNQIGIRIVGYEWSD